jgi:hypothetical protein
MTKFVGRTQSDLCKYLVEVFVTEFVIHGHISLISENLSSNEVFGGILHDEAYLHQVWFSLLDLCQQCLQEGIGIVRVVSRNRC